MRVIGSDAHRDFAQAAILENGLMKDHGRFAMARDAMLILPLRGPRKPTSCSRRPATRQSSAATDRPSYIAWPSSTQPHASARNRLRQVKTEAPLLSRMIFSESSYCPMACPRKRRAAAQSLLARSTMLWPSRKHARASRTAYR